MLTMDNKRAIMTPVHIMSFALEVMGRGDDRRLERVDAGELTAGTTSLGLEPEASSTLASSSTAAICAEASEGLWVLSETEEPRSLEEEAEPSSTGNR
jgi:hypothetical protein